MPFTETQLKPNSIIGSGGVRRYNLPGDKCSITRITTFCPDVIGPGPTHMYLIQNEALILMDTGIPTHLAKAFFYYWRNQPIPPEVENLSDDHSEQEFLEGMELAGYSIPDIDLLLISHGHPDHFLMGNAILSRGKAVVSAHILDTPEICNPWGMLNMWISKQQQMIAVGMPPPSSPKQLLKGDQLRGFDLESLGVSIKVDTPILQDSPLAISASTIEGVEVKHLPGHSPGSIGLLVGKPRGEKVLLCGDVLLSPITPHPDDLLVYLQTLEELGNYDDVALVLPAHGRIVQNLKNRVAFLKEHHRNRLELTYEACRMPRCVWDIASMPDYFNTYVDPNKFNFLAGLEALVHIEVLNMVEGVRRSNIRDEVHYFQSSEEPFEEIYGRIMELVADKRNRPIMRY